MSFGNDSRQTSESRHASDSRHTSDRGPKALSFSHTAHSEKKGYDGHSRSILHRESDLDECRVFLDGKDVTPVALDPHVYVPIKPVGIDFHLGTVDGVKTFHTQSSAQLFKTQLHTQNLEGDAAFHQSLYFKSEELEMDFLMAESELSEKSGSSSASESTEDSGDKGDIEMTKIPTSVTLILKETDTFFILDLPSSTTLKDSDEGHAVEEDNQRYEFLTTGKGRNRRVFDAEAQTVKVLLKTRNTQTERQKRKTGSTFASNWEMYDTLLPPEPDIVSEEENTSSSSEAEVSEDDEHKLVLFEKVEKEVVSSEDIQLLKIVKMPKFQDALCVIERLLANNCYNEQQKRFRGLSDPDPHREDIDYKYTLKLLWTFSNDKTRERCVTSINWNKTNPDILAVGYGKFYFMDNTTGMVMLWNIKNPRQPERQYEFPDPVTTVCFSNVMPNVLAVGFYFGKVSIINIADRTLNVIAETSLAVSPSFEACWQIMWDGEEDDSSKEHILACFEDGRVCRYDLQKNMIKCSQIMRMARAEGKLKGTVITGACDTSIIPISRYAAALFITKHPKDPSIYYVGTNEGVIHTCSTNYYNQHVDLFSAHNGPVYSMRFSPFCNRVYVTCGEDWYLRLWVEGISDPIGEMTKTMDAVQDVDWSPTHSTILVAIRGKEINVWDIQRKIYNPQSVCRSPTNSRNTVCKFTQNGRCLVVGDIDGNIHVFSLEDMPFPAFFQDDLLIQALKRALVAEPEMLSKLRKFGRLSFDTKHS